MPCNCTRVTCVFPINTSPSLFTAMLRMSGLKSREAVVAVGRSILMDWSLIMVRLAIMNEASRKNMMSINGMISIRAFLCGNGEPIGPDRNHSVDRHHIQRNDFDSCLFLRQRGTN